MKISPHESVMSNAVHLLEAAVPYAEPDPVSGFFPLLNLGGADIHSDTLNLLKSEIHIRTTKNCCFVCFPGADGKEYRYDEMDAKIIAANQKKKLVHAFKFAMVSKYHYEVPLIEDHSVPIRFI